MELFQFITTILQRYEIHSAEQGRLPSLDGHLGITYTPAPFKVRFLRRDLLELNEAQESTETAEG